MRRTQKTHNIFQGCSDFTYLFTSSPELSVNMIQFHLFFFPPLRKPLLPVALRCGQDGPHSSTERQRAGSQHSQDLPDALSDVKPVLGAHSAHLHRDAAPGHLAEQIHHSVQGRRGEISQQFRIRRVKYDR